MSKPIISVEHLSKAYRLGTREDIPDTFVGAMTGWLKAPVRNWQRLRRLNTFGEVPVDSATATAENESKNGDPPSAKNDSDTFWALRDVSFAVNEGEVIGIIGRNGAGKSTLLKILSRITEPTDGRAVIRGRVSSLLEVGTGFHPELTGRENVYMNGTILGMRKKEIDKKFDEIVDFSGVAEFLDTPIKRYSSGMQVRLAFAVAAHLEPEILIIDEVLAVGDAEFQKKCLGKMQDVAKCGRTVLFVSHNMAAVQGLCSRVLWMQQGALQHEGPTKSVISDYYAQGVHLCNGHGHRFHPLNEKKSTSNENFAIDELRITSNGVLSPEGYAIGAPLRIEIDCRALKDLVGPVFMISIHTKLGQAVIDCHSLRASGAIPERLYGSFTVTCHPKDLNLVPGDYVLRLAIKERNQWFFAAENAGVFTILPTDYFGSGKTHVKTDAFILCKQDWQIKQHEKAICPKIDSFI